MELKYFFLAPLSALLGYCLQILAFEKTIFVMRQFLPLAEVRDVHYETVDWRCCAEDNNWRTLDISGSSLIEIIIPAVRFQLFNACLITVLHHSKQMQNNLFTFQDKLSEQ